MNRNMTMAERILDFDNKLSQASIVLPEGYRIINPFTGTRKEQIKAVTTAFYQKYYNDGRSRRLILGSSPARRGTAVTGVPFEDAMHLQVETGIVIDEFYINKPSSGFLYDVMEAYGGCDKFYAHFYMNFVCPLGIVKVSPKGNEVNCNYYDNKNLQEILKPFIVATLKSQLEFGIDTSVCYCIGSGKNFTFLTKINDEYGFFNAIMPLEHPRFIMQYNSKKKDIFLEKYLNALSIS